MPHIRTKFKPFDEVIDIASELDIVEFVAVEQDNKEIIFGLNYKDENFLLVYRAIESGALLKYEKITRPLKLATLKEALEKLCTELRLEVLDSNITTTRQRPPLFASKYYKRIESFSDIEFTHDKVSIEVGFGSGRHILYQANTNQDTLYIGIEIHTPSAQQLLKQIEIQGLNNIWVVNYDARLFFEMLPPNIASQVFVHFPVPWDKKPLRRVISSSFTNEALRILDIDGTLELRTDSDLYYKYAFDVFSMLPKLSMNINKNHALPVMSKYEARWVRQEKDIYDVVIKCEEKSNKKEQEYSFLFGDFGYNILLKNTISKDSFIYDDYFVHFESIYMIGTFGLIIKCAFGSFERPEHKYIILTDNKVAYYPSLPIASKSNYNAHLKIKEFLNVNNH